MVYLITESKDQYFRWHDSGDIQGLWHLENIAEVAKQTPHVKHWLPTREYSFVKRYLAKYETFPPNLTVRLSAHMIEKPAPNIDGLAVSSVHSDIASYPDAWICPAPTQGNSCGSCRACWDISIPHVSYTKH